MKFFCVQLCRGRLALDNQDLDELMRFSDEMCVKRERKRMVKGSSFEGMIRTEFTNYAIGSATGLLFIAELDVEGSPTTTKVHYLVREAPREIQEAPDEKVVTVWATRPHVPHQCPPPLYGSN